MMRNSKWIWTALLPQLALLMLASGCFSNGSSKLLQTLGQRAQLGFSQSPQLVHTIEISRSAPEAWSARFTRGEPLVSGEDPSWQIDSLLNPKGHPFKDRIAFQDRIDHLLKTLATLTVLGPAPRGSLASQGLSPPLASLRWQTEDATWELALGEVQSDGTQVCHSPLWREPQLCQGAALEMIAQVEKLDQMRLPTWATFKKEDIEQIEVRLPGRSEFKAVRSGAYWVSRGKKVALDEQLERLTHTRIREFLDEEAPSDPRSKEKSKQLARALQEGAELVFHHSTGDSTSLRVATSNGRLIGTNSARPEGRFELHPETAKLIQKLAQP